MAEFEGGFHGFKPSLPFIEMDPSMELMSHFAEMSESVMENPSLGLMSFNDESYLSQQHDFSIPFSENLSGLIHVQSPKPIMDLPPMASAEEHNQGDRKRKAKAVPETSSGNSSTLPPESELTDDKPKGNNGSGRVKRGRCNSKEGEKPKEVVHVRARRGQATDSHSLAERVRREKINEKMRCLQDLVPGCYKAMGMAVMLDEIINYVQSLQNQVEFLSMKLSAASSFYDFNLELEAMPRQQMLPRVGDGYEGQEEVERLSREGYGGCTSFNPAMPF